jgi:hypothetical protein
MNPHNVTYTSYPTSNDPNYHHSSSRSFSQARGTPKASASNLSYSPQTNLATMAGTPSHHAYTPSLATGMNVGMPGAAGGPGSTLQRSGTRNSYLSYADTPSWINPSIMMETSTPATRTSRPLPDPQRYSAPRYIGPQPGHQGDSGGYIGRGSGYAHQQGRPTSGGFFITNVTEEEEEELEGEGGEEGGYVDVHPPSRPHPHQQQHNIRLPNGYNNVPNNGYLMPIGMKGGKGVPMERVAPPGQYHHRPLPVPGASQPLGRIDSLKWKKKKETSSPHSPSLAGSLFAGLKRLPKKVLRYGRKKSLMMDEGDEEFGNLRNFEDMLPGYASHPATPTGLGGNINSPIKAEPENRMPGEMPVSPPQQRFRNPSLKLTRPSGETLRQGLNAEDQEFFDHSNAHNDHISQPPPPAVEYPAPSIERERTTVMMYHENEEESNAPPIGRSESAFSRRGSSSDTGSPIPTPVIDTTVSPPVNQSPETAHPQPANDYMKMTASPRTAGTQVTEYTSFSTDPSFTSDLNPVFRFFAGFYHLPWFSERSTVDYSPLTGFGQKSGGRGGRGKKEGQSWYRKKGDTAGLSASLSLDLLSSGEGDRDGEDRGSVISPLGGWRRRGGRRNAVDRVGGGGGGRHGHYIRRQDTRPGHGRGHGHGHRHGQRHGDVNDSRRVRGRRYRRRSTSTITFEEYHHQRNISPMVPSSYPFPFVSPPFPYFAYPPPTGPTQDTNIAPNQGTPARTGGGEEGTSKDETSQQQGQTGLRGPRYNTNHGPQGRSGGGGPVFAPGYAPSPVYPTPVWYGDAVDQRRVVYMPMSVPLPL